jgi:transcriptional regulator GlxA family with amidase domain
VQRIGFIIPERFQMLALAPQTVFEYANMSAGKAVYDVRVLSDKGRPLRSTIGIALQTERFSDRRFDTLIFGGTNEATPRLTPGLLSFARRALRNSRRVASMCTGAFVLAEAGLLDGRRATPPGCLPQCNFSGKQRDLCNSSQMST